MGAAGDKPFGEYLKALGLSPEVEQEPPKPKKSAKELIAWAKGLTEKAKEQGK